MSVWEFHIGVLHGGRRGDPVTPTARATAPGRRDAWFFSKKSVRYFARKTIRRAVCTRFRRVGGNQVRRWKKNQAQIM